MTELHYPSQAIAASNGHVGAEGAAVAPSIPAGMDSGVGTILGAWPTRFASSLAA